MATTTVATVGALIAALAALGEGDTILVEDGTYTFTAGLEKTSGTIPTIKAVNPWAVVFRFTKTYSWTAAGDEYYCTPDKSGGTISPYEIPNGLWSPDGLVYKQAHSGWYPYDYATPPLGNQFDVTASFPTPDNAADFEMRCHVPFDIKAFKGTSIVGSTITVTNMLNEAVATAFDWQSSPDYQILSRVGVAVMNQAADMRPGTWRWDSANSRLYVMPVVGEVVNDLRVPVNIRRGIRLAGADNFNIEGIIFEGLNAEPHWGPIGFSDCGALYIIDCQNVTINVRVRNTAGAGVRMKILTEPPGEGACNDNIVVNSSFVNVGGQALVVAGEDTQVLSNSFVNCGSRTLCSPAISAQFVRRFRAIGNSTTGCGGGSIQIAADNDDYATGPYLANHHSLNDMFNQLGDRGCVYIIGRKFQGGTAAILTGYNITIERATTNGSGDHALYADEGSYFTITNLRIKGYGALLGWYDSTKNSINPASGSYDAYSGRTVFWNDPDGPSTFHGGVFVGDRVTLDVRTSTEITTLNGVKFVTRVGELTNGTFTRTGLPGIPDPP